MNPKGRLIIVANRLPVTIERGENGLAIHPSSGGLVSALLPIFNSSRGFWIGWPGTCYESEIECALRAEDTPEHSLKPVFLTADEKSYFYDGCCNEIIWPLFHDLQFRCNFDSKHWSVYQAVNDKFADSVEQVVQPGDFVWAHDYHLMLLAGCLRTRGVRCRVAYFHHIPFPCPDIFEKLPRRRELLSSLLRYTLLGFQTHADRRNFLRCIQRCFPGARIRRVDQRFLVQAHNERTEVTVLPISIDFESFVDASRKPSVAAKVKEIRRSVTGGQIVLGIDRLDYTKGIPERLIAFRTLLESEPHRRGRVTLVQLVVPSREQVAGYHECRTLIERLVSEINGEFGYPGWVPVIYLHRCVSAPDLLALYRAAHVALVTPLKDGMNLVAKEFCATRWDEQGVLILSEFAGSAHEMKNGALLVNPFDTRGVASTVERALLMTESEQRVRMRQMRHVIALKDVYQWFRSLCGDTVPRTSDQLDPVLPLRKGVQRATVVSPGQAAGFP